MKKILSAVFLLLSASLAFATEPAPLTSGAAVHLTGTVGTMAATILNSDGARKYLQIQNVGSNTNVLACTIDGTTPAVAGNGIQLSGVSGGAGQTQIFNVFVPTGAVNCIGSASSTGYVVTFLP